MNILSRYLPLWDLFLLEALPLWATNDSHGANQIELKKIRHTIKHAPKSNFLEISLTLLRKISQKYTVVEQ